MLFFVFQGAYVGFPPVTLDIDSYLRLSFKQPRLNGTCCLSPSKKFILPFVRTDW